MQISNVSAASIKDVALYCVFDINQANFYSTNIPSETRISEAHNINISLPWLYCTDVMLLLPRILSSVCVNREFRIWQVLHNKYSVCRRLEVCHPPKHCIYCCK